MAVKKTTEQFVVDARLVHGDKYDYSKAVYQNALTKVAIICKEHGVFHQKPNSHLSSKQGCPECARVLRLKSAESQRMSTEEWISKAREVHGDRYDYSKTVCQGQHNNLIIICPVHGEFEQIARGHLRGNRCPFCSNRTPCDSNCLDATHPDVAAQWHPTKNGDLTPKDVTYGSNVRVWWKCEVAEDHEWEAIISSRTQQGGECPCCLNKTVVPSNCLDATHPDVAAQWHPTKNGDLTPKDVTYGSNVRVWWKCKVAEDHEWEASVNDRINKDGQPRECPCCLNLVVVPSNCLDATHPDIAAQWHPTKNGDLTPKDVTISNTCKVWWKCEVAEDHEWESPIGDRRILGCPCCSNRKVVPSNMLTTTHPNLAAQWHHTKNGDLTPKDVTAGSGSKVWWQCSKFENHEWEARIVSRAKYGCGCPHCKESKGEKRIRDCLIYRQITFTPQWQFLRSKIKKNKFDFSVNHPNFTGLIEYQGEPHFKPTSFGGKKKYAKESNLMKYIQRDHKKLQWCRRHKIPLLIIPYWDYERIPEIIDDVFAGRTPTFSEPLEKVKKYAPIRQKIRDRLRITEPEVLCGFIRQNLLQSYHQGGNHEKPMATETNQPEPVCI